MAGESLLRKITGINWLWSKTQNLNSSDRVELVKMEKLVAYYRVLEDKKLQEKLTQKLSKLNKKKRRKRYRLAKKKRDKINKASQMKQTSHMDWDLLPETARPAAHKDILAWLDE